MDAEELISAVFVRVALWDRKNKNYHNRIYIDKLWNEVSKELKEEREVLKKKWKQLRDQFRLELKKISKDRSGDEAHDDVITWPYFESMYFLKDQMKFRPSSGNFKPHRIYQLTEKQEEHLEPEDDLYEEENSEIGSGYKDEVIEIKEVKTSSSEADIIENEKRKLKLLEREHGRKRERDEDESFFDSLLPHVRKLKPSQKLTFRMQVQSIVQDLVYNPSQQPYIIPTNVFRSATQDNLHSSTLHASKDSNHSLQHLSHTSDRSNLPAQNFANQSCTHQSQEEMFFESAEILELKEENKD